MRKAGLVVAGLASLLLALPSVSIAQKAPPSGSIGPDPPSICDAVSNNLVTNCGFETGDFTGWTTVPAASGSDFGVFPSHVNSGRESAFFGAVGTLDDTISQTLATDAGHVENISFYLTNAFSAPGQAEFFAYWDGTQIFSASSSAFPYTQFSFQETGTGSDTLTFAGLQVPDFYYLDDVVVTTTPEPTTFVLLSIGLVGMLGMVWRRRRQLLVA